MNSEKNLATVGVAAVECRKSTARVIVESLLVIVVCVAFAGSAWGLPVGLPVLRIICLITFMACAGGASRRLQRILLGSSWSDLTIRQLSEGAKHFVHGKSLNCGRWYNVTAPRNERQDIYPVRDFLPPAF